MNDWKKYIIKYPVGRPITEEDLKQINIWSRREEIKKDFLQWDERKDCILIQGGSFVTHGHAFLLLGMGTIDILETLSQFNDIDGIIGTGNALFISKDFKYVYSVLSEAETLKRYEINKTAHRFKYLAQAKLAPLIILNRAIKDEGEFERVRRKKKDQVIFGVDKHFFTKPIKYAGSLKARLRSKFIAVARTVHCVGHPTMFEKELIFDSFDDVKKLIDKFVGYFLLGYALWSKEFANSIGIEENYTLNMKENPSEIIGFIILKLVQQFYKGIKIKKTI